MRMSAKVLLWRVKGCNVVNVMSLKSKQLDLTDENPID